jgi:hypothetical protein
VVVDSCRLQVAVITFNLQLFNFQPSVEGNNANAKSEKPKKIPIFIDFVGFLVVLFLPKHHKSLMPPSFKRWMKVT